MKASQKNLKICSEGHRYYKSSDCPVCPICEKLINSDEEFLSVVGAPARRALERAGIKTLQQLSERSEEELLQLHGFGPGSIPKLRGVLKVNGLSFKKNKQ